MTSAKAAGLLVTAQNLRRKLAELKKREKEVENNKGFFLSGVSKQVDLDDDKDDLAAQEEMIFELIDESDLAQLREQEEQKEKDVTKEDEAEVLREFASLDEALHLANSVKKNLEERGFSCSISTRGNDVKLEINSGFEVPSCSFLQEVVTNCEDELSHGHVAALLSQRSKSASEFQQSYKR